jgi:alginate O-acetyltransferase complex protein AlgI
VQPRAANTALYIALFPQLIAGPIVRYHDIARQLGGRRVTLDDFRYGVVRFLVGLAKKVLIANVMGQAADHIFSIPASDLDPATAWLGAVAYTLQIYFDFSGYSDMAIGLGRMFGFRFLENFDFPYISRSIREFWRRWHISLSNWFRDYVYVPLGGNRRAPARVYANLVIVFFLTGLWHGASWNFIVWGMYHGAFLVLERTPAGALLARMPALLQHAYVLFVVIVGWVFFRADDLGHALDYLAAMFAFGRPAYIDIYLVTTLSDEFTLMLIAGILLSGVHRLPPMVRIADSLWLRTERQRGLQAVAEIGHGLLTLLLFAYTVVHLAGSPYNPFLYFRF